LILSGDITVKAAKPLVQRTFGRWKAVDASKLPPNPLNEFKKYDLPKEVVIHLVDRPASAQTEIIIGNLALARNHPDWVSLQVANGILGDDATGRLFMDIREERGLTYNINSTVSEAQAPGTFSIVTRTRTKSTGEMLAATFEHLGKIRAEAPTPEEVATVSNKMIGAFPLGLETPQQIAGKVREVLIYNLPEDYWRDYRDEIAEVTPKSVHEAARKYIHPVPHVVLVGKAKAIEKQVREVLPKAKIIKYNADLQPVK
jgi:predicted Zn-dependent peptidase